MLLLTSKIEIKRRENGQKVRYLVKPAEVAWRCSVASLVDTCTITVPSKVYMKNDTESTETPDRIMKTSFMPFKEGDEVTVQVGYDGELETVFKGFLKRVNSTIPVTLECEGYIYPLHKVYFTKSYKKVGLRQLLADLTEGTGIQLSKHISEIEISNVTFRNAPGLKVLEWLQKECLLTVFFDFETLYAGAARYGIPKPTQKLRLGWNTVDDTDFKKNVNNISISIELINKNPEGQTMRTRSEASKYDATREVKIRSGLPVDFVAAVRAELQRAQDYSGYKGTVTCFLQPYFGKGYACEVTDNRYPDRAGMYIVETVEGSYGKRGGRQKITLNYYGRVDS